MSPSRTILAAALLGSLGACSTIVEGTSQTIQINTIPSEAKCDLFREGAVIGTVASTPGSVTFVTGAKDRHRMAKTPVAAS